MCLIYATAAQFTSFGACEFNNVKLFYASYVALVRIASKKDYHNNEMQL